MNLLEVEALNVASRDTGKPLIEEIGFSLDAGERLTLLGQSGSGKTMTCRAILGLLSRRAFRVSGSVRFCGSELMTLHERDRKKVYGSKIAFIPQNPMTAFDPSRTLGHQMAEFLRLRRPMARIEARARLIEALREAGLSEAERVMDSLPGRLSGGMLQRALIALAIGKGAQLVIADEPTTALDAIHRDRIVEQLALLQDRGCAILLVTHDFAVAQKMGGAVKIMRAGRVVEGGPIEEVLAAPRAAYTRELIAALRLDWRERAFAGSEKSV